MESELLLERINISNENWKNSLENTMPKGEKLVSIEAKSREWFDTFCVNLARAEKFGVLLQFQEFFTEKANEGKDFGRDCSGILEKLTANKHVSASEIISLVWVMRRMTVDL